MLELETKAASAVSALLFHLSVVVTTSELWEVVWGGAKWEEPHHGEDSIRD